MISLTRHQRSLISRHISKSNSLKKDRFAFVRRYTTPASNKSSVSDLAKKAFETSKEVTLAILSIFKNYKASRPIKKRIADGDETVTRKEFQLLRQSDYDIRVSYLFIHLKCYLLTIFEEICPCCVSICFAFFNSNHCTCHHGFPQYYPQGLLYWLY